MAARRLAVNASRALAQRAAAPAVRSLHTTRPAFGKGETPPGPQLRCAVAPGPRLAGRGEGGGARCKSMSAMWGGERYGCRSSGNYP